MHLIAHRGWAAGSQENSLAAFELAARDPDISGVELDVCRAADTGTLLVCTIRRVTPKACSPWMPHCRFCHGRISSCSWNSKRRVWPPQSSTSSSPTRSPSARSCSRSPGWPDPFRGATCGRCDLGVIVMYPWQLDRMVREFAPDVLLLGWDDRSWTRMAFRAWWSLFSLERLGSRHRLPVVAGIVQRSGDLRWLSRQHLYAAVADIDRVRGARS